MKSIIITGDPVDGFDYTGPFDSAEKATEWAEEHCDPDWWVADIFSPQAYPAEVSQHKNV
jgi:hypothetical protein